MNRADVELMERVCTEDVPALLEQLDEVDGLRAALAEAQRELQKVEEERDTFRTERNAAFVALRDALGTDSTTLGQATLHAVKAVADLDAARAEAGQLRTRLDAAWAVVREGTANMRAQLATVRAERDEARTLAGVCGDLLDETRTERERAQQAGRDAEAERDAACEEVRRVRKMHVSVILGGTCTACGHHAPCPTIRALDEAAAEQISAAATTGPDPRLIALEELALRYSHAFEVLYADARARATRKKANHG